MPGATPIWKAFWLPVRPVPPEPGVYAGGFALMTTSVLGHMAGENATRLLQTLPEVKSDLSDAEITARQQALFAPLGKEGLTPKEVLTSIQKTVFPYWGLHPQERRQPSGRAQGTGAHPGRRPAAYGCYGSPLPAQAA